MYLPENIRKIIGNREFSIDTVGMSGSQVLCFDDMVLKTEPVSIQTENEAAMMAWLNGKLPVPNILAHEIITGRSYLLMSRAGGRMLCESEYLCKPNKLVNILADALQILWDTAITDLVPLITLDEKLKIAGENVSNGLCDIENAEPDTYGPDGFASPEKLLQWLTDNKPVEQPVLSHGDFCLPNIFAIGDTVSSFIDLGRCGISDKYQDIALCWRSLQHNYDGRYGNLSCPDFNADILFDALDLRPDRELLRYYILLDELL